MRHGISIIRYIEITCLLLRWSFLYLRLCHTAQYRCSICDINFPFKSKLERHLKSDGHRMFVECMQASSTQEADDFDDISCDVEVCTFCVDVHVRGGLCQFKLMGKSIKISLLYCNVNQGIVREDYENSTKILNETLSACSAIIQHLCFVCHTV